MRRSCTYIYIDLSLSVTCIFEGSLNDVIMAQHAKELKLLADKGLVSSVASFLSLWSLLSHSYFLGVDYSISIYSIVYF